MPITSEKEIKLATTQKIVWRHIGIDHAATGEKTAQVVYDVYNENDQVVDRYTIRYSGAEYNDWWHNFNDGKSVYDAINLEQNLGAVVDEAVEDDFINEL